MTDSTQETSNAATTPLYPTQQHYVLIPRPQDLKSIHTERLILRPLRIDNDEDAAGIFRTRSRQDVVDWLQSPLPDSTPEDTKTWMRGKIFAAPDGQGGVAERHFFFAMLLNDDERTVIGVMGVNSLDPAPSVGYAVHPDVWGKGYASEAARAVVAAWWGLPRMEIQGVEEEKLYASLHCANAGSLKVLKRAGFEVYGIKDVGHRIAFLSMGR
ncbi:GNAT domain-containing protein [Aspergillus californicus]